MKQFPTGNFLLTEFDTEQEANDFSTALYDEIGMESFVNKHHIHQTWCLYVPYKDKDIAVEVLSEYRSYMIRYGDNFPISPKLVVGAAGGTVNE